MSSASLKSLVTPSQQSHGLRYMSGSSSVFINVALSRCPKTSKQSRGVKCGQVGPTQLFLDFKRLSKMTKVCALDIIWAYNFNINQLQEPIDAKSRTNMGWWSTNSVYMSQVCCFVKPHCHRFAVLWNHILRGKVKHWISSCGRNGLQSHADEEEEARQESGGGKSLTFQVDFQIFSQ